MPVVPVEAVLWALLTLTPWREDAQDPGEVREEMLRPWAEAIAATAVSYEHAAAMVAVGRHESRWARYILEGRCLDGPPGLQCDLKPNGEPWSIGPWQLRKVACPEAWEPAASPYIHARCAARLLLGAKSRCAGIHPGGEWAGAFSGFNVGCQWPGAVERERTRKSVLSRLWATRWPDQTFASDGRSGVPCAHGSDPEQEEAGSDCSGQSCVPREALPS